MKPKVYIDGKEGTTGLQIYDRLAVREDIELLLIDESKRKDPAERKQFLNAADLVFLCLPDAAAVEAVSLIENGQIRVIDCSTATGRRRAGSTASRSCPDSGRPFERRPGWRIRGAMPRASSRWSGRW